MVDVLIIGAGPSGLTFARELLKYGVTFRIIDHKPTHSIHSKALGIYSRMLELFERLVVVDECLKRGRELAWSFSCLGVKTSRYELNFKYLF